MMVLDPVTTTKTCTMTSTGYMSVLKSLTICRLRCLKVRTSPRYWRDKFLCEAQTLTEYGLKAILCDLHVKIDNGGNKKKQK